MTETGTVDTGKTVPDSAPSTDDPKGDNGMEPMTMMMLGQLGNSLLATSAQNQQARMQNNTMRLQINQQATVARMQIMQMQMQSLLNFRLGQKELSNSLTVAVQNFTLAQTAEKNRNSEARDKVRRDYQLAEKEIESRERGPRYSY